MTGDVDCAAVARKHAETKQFYTLYNTLSDCRAFLEREVKLLNSVIDAYPTFPSPSPRHQPLPPVVVPPVPRAAESETAKAELVRQLEEALDAVRTAAARSDRALNEERLRRDAARDALEEIRDKKRLYHKTVADFHEVPSPQSPSPVPSPQSPA